MSHLTTTWAGKGAPALRQWWYPRKTVALRFAVGIMAVLALLKLGDEFRRLLWESGRSGAIDLKNYREVVQAWFEGTPVYREFEHAVLPPASYLMLWPLMGWLAFPPARWLWAITSLGVLATLSWLLLREGHAESPVERAFVALLLLSMNSTGVAIGNGQLPLHVLLATLAAVLLVAQRRDRWRDHVLAAALLVLALVKPTVSVPFIWMGLFTAVHGVWLGVFVIAGYGVLTLAAAAAQDIGLVQLFADWLARGSYLAGSAGYANLNVWMSSAGLSSWMLVGSATVLLALGWWVFRHRSVDPWILLGVSALAARFWAYHRMYDDVLVVLPMVALFRLAKRGPSADGSDVTAGVLLVLLVLLMLVPARLGFERSPVVALYNVSHAVVWLGVLWFLVQSARRQRPAAAEARAG